LHKNYGILEPVLGGTAGRRSIRCGGLQLFRPLSFPAYGFPWLMNFVSSLALFQGVAYEWRASSDDFGGGSLRGNSGF